MVGAGAWGTAMGASLMRNEHEVTFLRRGDDDWPEHLDMVFVAIPCQVLRERLSFLRFPHVPVVGLVKGIEVATGKRVSQVMREVWPEIKAEQVGVLSGPTLAYELEKGLPAAAVAAAESEVLAQCIQECVHQKLLRVYSSTDLIGVELAGALKNIYAIAGGICQGLRIGENGTAALMTRSLAEMVRMAMAMGGQMQTLFGLSGVGDLMLTSYSGRSRNHQIGVLLGEGLSIEKALEQVKGVAEGVPTIQAVHKICHITKIKSPILDELYSVIYERKPVLEAFNDLTLRQAAVENL